MTTENSTMTHEHIVSSAGSSTNSTVSIPINQNAASSTNSYNNDDITKLLATMYQPLTANQIKAQGEVKTRTGIIWFVGIIIVLIIIFGGVFSLIYPDKFKDTWAIFAPIVSSAVTGALTYFITDQNKSSN